MAECLRGKRQSCKPKNIIKDIQWKPSAGSYFHPEKKKNHPESSCENGKDTSLKQEYWEKIVIVRLSECILPTWCFTLFLTIPWHALVPVKALLGYWCWDRSLALEHGHPWTPRCRWPQQALVSCPHTKCFKAEINPAPECSFWQENFVSIHPHLSIAQGW